MSVRISNYGSWSYDFIRKINAIYHKICSSYTSSKNRVYQVHSVTLIDSASEFHVGMPPNLNSLCMGIIFTFGFLGTCHLKCWCQNDTSQIPFRLEEGLAHSGAEV
jgi:hypothetical protein